MAALSAALAIAPGTAGAQADDAEVEARRQFQRGQQHYTDGSFAEAAEAFEAAYRASGRPRLLFNAYLAYRDLQDDENAARTLRQFLVEADDLPPDDRAQLRARLAALEQALTHPDGTAEPSASGGDSDEPAEDGTAAPPEAERAGSPASDAAGDDEGGFHPSPVGFVVAGAGAALLLGAVATAVISGDDYGTLEERCPTGACPDDDALRDAQSRGEALTIATDVLWIAGAATLVAGVVSIFVLQDEPGAEDRPTVAAACATDGCFGALQMRFE